MCFYILYFFVYSLLLIVYFYFTFSFLFRKMLLVPPQRLILSSQFCFILLLFDFRLIPFFAKRFLFLHRDWYWHLYFTFIFFYFFLLDFVFPFNLHFSFFLLLQNVACSSTEIDIGITSRMKWTALHSTGAFPTFWD